MIFFKSFLKCHNFLTVIYRNSLISDNDVEVDVSQGSVLSLLLFLVYINGLNQALKFCKVHHFADDTNLIHFSKSVSRLNKYVNLDLKSRIG